MNYSEANIFIKKVIQQYISKFWITYKQLSGNNQPRYKIPPQASFQDCIRWNLTIK